MNLSFKKLLLFLLLFTKSFLFAKDLVFYISPRFSFNNSCAKEYLYNSGTFNTDPKKVKSLLEWSEKSVMSYGIEFSLQAPLKNSSAFIFSFLTDFKIPYNTAKMTDSDFTSSGTKFNYSKFNCTIADSSFSDFTKNIYSQTSFSYKKTFFYDFDLISSLGFLYNSFYYRAEDGFGWYGSASYSSDGKTHAWNSPYAHYFPDGKMHLAGINYYVQTIAFFTGLSLQKKLNDSFTLGSSFKVFPFSYVIAKDRHLGSMDYYDFTDFVTNFFKSYEASFFVSTKLSSFLAFNMTLSYYDFLNTRAESYYYFDEGGREKSSSDGGFSYKNIKFTSSLSIKLKK